MFLREHFHVQFCMYFGLMFDLSHVKRGSYEEGR